MNQKKIRSILGVLILTFAMTVPLVSTIQAVPPPPPSFPDYTIYGFIYLNGVRVVQNGGVNISNTRGEYYLRDVTYPGGLYKKSFTRSFATYGETIYFKVRIGYNFYTPVGNSSFVIPDQPPASVPYQIDFYLHTYTNYAPYKPINPIPSNGATGISTNPTLSVTVTDPDGDFMDVKFYTADTQQLIGSVTHVANGSTASIVWPGLAPNTLYRWYAVANDTLLQNTSSTFSFTTMTGGGGNSPPYQPQTPTPNNHAIHIPVTGTLLSWSGGDPDAGDVVTYDVYFGTTNPPTNKVSSNQSGTTYNPGSLNYDSTYYWKIVAWDNHGHFTAGPVWDFTTQSAPNTPPYIPGNITPANGSTGQSINIDLSWTGGDPNVGDTVIYTVYFGTNPNPPLYDTTPLYPSTQLSITYTLPTLLLNTHYYWKIVATDNHGAEVTSPIWSFTTALLGDTQPPSNITGLTVTDAYNGKLNIAWNPATDNIAVAHYEIYRDGTFLLNRTTTSYQDTGLTNGQSYAYRVRAVDTSGNLGNLSPPVSGTPTVLGGGGGGSGSGGSDDGATGGGNPSSPPTADANGPYTGFVGEEITFDGTGSTGFNLTYDWKFFDTDIWHTNIGPTPTYSYTQAGTYIVTLRVTNIFGNSTDTASVTILTGNNPPTKPSLIKYKDTGNKNVEYTYTAIATDLDNDTIMYTFDWGDGIQTETGYLPNAREVSVNHSWVNAGKYRMWVQAMDYLNATSEKTYLTILIDAINVADIGYLTDDTSDGTYDLFHSNDGGVLSAVEKQTDGTYLIDSDGDGEWNWIYDPETDMLTPYARKESAEENPNMALWYALIAGILIAIILILVVYRSTKNTKKKKKKQKKSP